MSSPVLEHEESNGLIPSNRQQRWDIRAGTVDQLKTALAREEVLLRERDELLRRQETLAQEFEHRLVNSLQLVASLLSMQSRTAVSAEAAGQLAAASKRVSSIGRVHRRLHLLDHRESVEIKRYLGQLCDDLSEMLFPEGTERTLAVTGVEARIPTMLGIPLGFAVNELVTNCAKYAEGNVTVQVDTAGPNFLVSVADDGPGLPTGFDPTASKGLGMKIVRLLVKQIGGTLAFTTGTRGRGACFTVAFTPQA
jgi:two-component system, sensor histidine kinase PdtaS